MIYPINKIKQKYAKMQKMIIAEMEIKSIGLFLANYLVIGLALSRLKH